MKNKIEWLDPLTCFDAERPVPIVDLEPKVADIVRQGDRHGRRRQMWLSLSVGACVVLGCWTLRAVTPLPSAQLPNRERVQVVGRQDEQLDEAIRAFEVQLATLDEVWRDYDRARYYRTDYRDYVRRELDHRLAAGLAANTLLHDARLEPMAERQQEKLQLVVEHFDGTEAAAEAVTLMANRPL